MSITGSVLEGAHEATGDPDHSQPSEYIITCDWARKMRLLRTIGLNVPDSHHPIYQRVIDGLIARIQAAFPSDTIKVTDMGELSEEIIGRAMVRKNSLRNATIISTCPEIAQLKGGHSLEINRIVDVNGKVLGLGPRPGHASIHTQVSALRHAIGKDPVILVEDGAFTGGTMLRVYELLHHASINVEAMVIGYAFTKALETIRASFPGDVMVVEEVGDFIDWMPDHDFFPFTPNCGRVVGVKWHEECLPLYDHAGASFAIPYLTSFCPIQEWTSIPKQAAFELSVYCLKCVHDFYREVEKLNGKEITFRDLAGIQPRVSYPLAVGSKFFPNPEQRVINYVSETMTEMD